VSLASTLQLAIMQVVAAALCVAWGLYFVRHADEIVQVLRSGKPPWLSVLLLSLRFRPMSLTPFPSYGTEHAKYVRRAGWLEIALGVGFLIGALVVTAGHAISHASR
jgi:hypothetical protein